MQKIFSTLAIALILSLTVSTAALASTCGKSKCPVGNKLKRGVVNILTSPLEIPKQTKIYWKKGSEKTKHISFWVVAGVVKGVANTVGRIGSGAWDVLTCNWDIPKNNEPLMKPDYVFECKDSTCSVEQPK